MEPSQNPAPVNQLPQKPEQPEVQPSASQKSPEYQKAKKRLTIMIVIVASAIPVSIMLGGASRFVRDAGGEGTGEVAGVIAVISLLVGVFGFVGWVPVIGMAIRLGKMK